MNAHASAAAPAILPLIVEQIPPALKAYPTHWAPWEAKYSAARGKIDKVPRSAKNPSFGVSTHKHWWSFTDAVAGYEILNLASDAGVGFNLTHAQDLVGIDLDRCIDADGTVAVWAREIIERSGSYAEVSPSGRGVRIFVRGATPDDWTDHEKGVEVYAGHAPRFLTVTGHRIDGCPDDVRPAPEGFLDWLATSHKPARVESPTAEPPADMPELIGPAELPSLEALNVPDHVLPFLREGELPDHGDGSRTLAAAARALCERSLDDAVVLSLLWANDHAREVALRHRRDDEDSALGYLWKHHVCAQRARVTNPADDFEALPDEPRTPAPPVRFQVTPAAEFVSGKPPAWIVRGVLPEAELAVIYGESTSGKSFLTLDLGFAVARGTEWRGRRAKQGGVVYVAAEGAGGFRKRLKAYAQHHGVDLTSLPLGVIDGAPNLMGKDWKAVADAIAAFGGASVIVIDTLAQTLAGGNENAGEDVGTALAHCKRIHEATGALVVLVHHSGKDATKGARGWSGLRAAADAEIEVTRREDERQARVTKQKDGDDGEVFPFRLQSVHLGVDEDMQDITSCVVAHHDQPIETTKKPAGRLQRAILEAVHDLQDLGEDTAPVAAVIARAIRDEPYDPGPDPNKPRRDQRATNARRALRVIEERGLLVVKGDQVRLPGSASTASNRFNEANET